MIRFFSVCLILLCAVAVATTHAQPPRVRYPLEGYFRPGKCIPVQLETSTTPIELQADTGAVVPTQVSAGRCGIVPLLVLTSAPTAIGGASLRPLMPDERLVGFTTPDAHLAAELFPSQKIVPIRLDSSPPLDGRALAWEALDAAILDRVLDEPKLTQLLSAGVVVAVRTDRQPDTKWPWKRVGDCWVVQPDLVGPEGSVGGDVAYLPAAPWQPGQPAGLRRQVVLVAVVISLVLTSTLLIRSKWSLAAMALLTLACAGSIEAWRRGTPSLRTAEGEVVVQHAGLIQHDRWRYVAATSDSPTSNATWRPILLDPQHAQQLALKLNCATDGSITWQYRVPPDGRLALLSRRVEPATTLPAVSATHTSPLYELARQAYQRGDLQIEGETPERDGAHEAAWPDVVLQNR